MTIINVEGMHGGKCVESITKAIEEAKLDFQVSLEDKTVTVEGCGQCVKTALEILDDLGFDGSVA